MASPVGIYILIFTMGLGIVFWIAPTVFIYLLCCLPLVLLRENKLLGAGLSIALAVGTATIPGVYVQKKTNLMLVQ